MKRLEVLKEILKAGTGSTQEDLVDALKKHKFEVTQSTVSRDLRRLGAVKTTNASNETVYRLSDETFVTGVAGGVAGLLVDIRHNGSMIVVRTTAGSASLVARHLDSTKPNGILGTLAGDDTVFVAPASAKDIRATIKEIENQLGIRDLK